jgi:hypothetical protein
VEPAPSYLDARVFEEWSEVPVANIGCLNAHAGDAEGLRAYRIR